jgi:hypothetical protein
MIWFVYQAIGKPLLIQQKLIRTLHQSGLRKLDGCEGRTSAIRK